MTKLLGCDLTLFERVLYFPISATFDGRVVIWRYLNVCYIWRQWRLHKLLSCDLTLFERVLYLRHNAHRRVVSCDLTLFERVLYFFEIPEIVDLGCDLTLFERVLYYLGNVILKAIGCDLTLFERVLYSEEARRKKWRKLWFDVIWTCVIFLHR